MSEVYQQLVKQIVQNPPKDKEGLLKAFRSFSREHKVSLPQKVLILQQYHKLLENQEIESNEHLERLLRKNAIRSLSGVTPISVMTAPLSCPSDCLYCPKEKNMPKSYLSNQPGAMRAVLADFNPQKQTQSRLKALKNNGHSTDKIEIIVNGGTWSAQPRAYQSWFLQNVFSACNHYEHVQGTLAEMTPSKKALSVIAQKLLNKHEINQDLYSPDDTHWMSELEKQQTINETAQNRIIGLSLETRPDHITGEELARMRQLGATKVEIGVQTLYQEVADLNRREQTNEQVIQATKLLKDAGFKIAYHMMPGMYGSTPEKDIEMMKDIYGKHEYRPDFLKIYPCVVVEESDLYELFKQGIYKPYSTELLVDTVVKIKKDIPRYTRIARLQREWVDPAGGCGITNFRELIQKELKNQDIECQCIRCREPKSETANPNTAELTVNPFKASEVQEYFLSFDSPDEKFIFAFLRLRMPSYNPEIESFIPELKDAAIVRELHTYGTVTPIDKVSTGNASQHLGFGKQLMLKAEELSRENGAKRLAVISGIGVREYYRKLGYRLEGSYMVKDL